MLLRQHNFVLRHISSKRRYNTYVCRNIKFYCGNNKYYRRRLRVTVTITLSMVAVTSSIASITLCIVTVMSAIATALSTLVSILGSNAASVVTSAAFRLFFLLASFAFSAALSENVFLHAKTQSPARDCKEKEA